MESSLAEQPFVLEFAHRPSKNLVPCSRGHLPVILIQIYSRIARPLRVVRRSWRRCDDMRREASFLRSVTFDLVIFRSLSVGSLAIVTPRKVKVQSV